MFEILKVMLNLIYFKCKLSIINTQMFYISIYLLHFN